jgi:hypothetical protein
MFEALRELLPGPICCSLNSLAWSDIQTLQYAYMFMHHTVKDFSLILLGVLTPSITKLLVRDILSRMPLLQILHVILGCGLGATSDMFMHLLQNLPNLLLFSLENAHLSSEMVQQWSCISQLKVLCSLYGHDEVDDQSFPLALRCCSSFARSHAHHQPQEAVCIFYNFIKCLFHHQTPHLVHPPSHLLLLNEQETRLAEQ